MLGRLRSAARIEADAILKSLPAELAERLAGVSIRLEERPTMEMVGRGVRDEAFAVTDGTSREVILFLMNIHDRHAAEPGGFRREFRLALLRELCELAGAEFDYGDWC